MKNNWWHNNGYKICRILLFWIWIPMWCYEKIQNKHYQSMKYSDKKTKKYLDKVLPQIIVAPDMFVFYNEYSFDGMNFYPKLFALSKPKKIGVYFHRFKKEVERYIIYQYQIVGYCKVITSTCADWIRIKKKFIWYNVPRKANDITGVVFYKKNIM